MSCPSLSGNQISFEIQSNWLAVAIVRFSGSTQKKVKIRWDTSMSPETIESCGLVEGQNYPFGYKNDGASTLNATVKVYFNNADCSSAGPGYQDANSCAQLMMNCNTPPAPASHVIVGAWEFKCPDSSDTVELTIMLEDEGFLGEM